MENKKLTIYFDEGCGICQKVKKTMSFFNWRNKYVLLNAEDLVSEEISYKKYIDLYAFDGDKYIVGYQTYLEIFKRGFIGYPFYLICSIPFIRNIGEKMYRKIADSRTCEFNSSKK